MNHRIFTLFLSDLEFHKKDIEPTDDQQYQIDCWQTCKSIDTALRKLVIAEQCIRKSHAFCPNDHQVAEYIEFHIENYIIRSRSVYGRVLIFTNFLCDIQMSKEYVNHNAIITNQKIEKWKLKNKLKSVNKACAIYRSERNGVIHHDKYVNEELDWIEAARKAKYILKGDIESIGITDDTILNNTAIVIAKHLHKFSDDTKKIISAVNSYLDDAAVIYDHKSKRT